MKRHEERLIAVGLLLLRVGFGGLIAGSHGLQKLAGFAEKSATFSDPLGVGSATSLGLAVFAEFFCASAVVLGLLTRLAAIPVITTMLVAILIVHADGPFSKQEFPLLYAIAFLTIALAGPGRISIDYLIAKRLKK